MITAGQRDAILARLTATGGPYAVAGMWLGVAVTIDNKGLATTLADVTVPSGDLGDRLQVTPLGAAHVKSDGRAMQDGPVLEFRPADYTEAATVAWWYLASLENAGELKAFGLLPTEYNLPDETASVSIVFRVVVDPSGEWDNVVVFNG